MVAAPIRHVRLQHADIVEAAYDYIKKHYPSDLETKYEFALTQEISPSGSQLVIDCTLSEVRPHTGDPVCTG